MFTCIQKTFTILHLNFFSILVLKKIPILCNLKITEYISIIMKIKLLNDMKERKDVN